MDFVSQKFTKHLRQRVDFTRKKDEHFNIGKFSKFFIQKKQKSVSELARKSLNTTLLGECSGSGTASEATFI